MQNILISLFLLVFNPVFDVTPAELVSVLVTEMGSVPRPSAPAIENLLKNRVTGL